MLPVQEQPIVSKRGTTAVQKRQRYDRVTKKKGSLCELEMQKRQGVTGIAPKQIKKNKKTEAKTKVDDGADFVVNRAKKAKPKSAK